MSVCKQSDRPSWTWPYPIIRASVPYGEEARTKDQTKVVLSLLSVAILLYAGRPEAGKAMGIDGRLPGEELFDGQRISFAGFFQAKQTTTHGGDNLCLTTNDPAARIWRRKVGYRQRAAIGADDILYSGTYHFGHWTLYTHSRPRVALYLATFKNCLSP